MTVRLTVLPAALAAAVALVLVGCTRNQLRRDPLRRQAIPALPAAEPVASTPPQAFDPPTPPPPPPLPQGSSSGRSAVRAQAVQPSDEQPPAPVTTAPPAVATLPPVSNPAPVAATPPVQEQIIPPPPPPGRGEVAVADAGPLDRLRDRRDARSEPRPPPRLSPKPSEPDPVAPPPARTPPPAPAPAPPVTAAIPTPAAAPAPSASASPADAARRLIEAAKDRYAGVNDFEARLSKREVVNGRAVPQDEVLYKFRKQPLSVYMKVLSEAGQGREVLFVKGRDDGAMHVVTGKGDNRLVGAGFKTTLDPDGRDATAKSRYRVYEAGFGRTIRGLEQAIQKGFRVEAVGPVQRKEYPYPLECVTVTATGGGDPSLPTGAKRSIYFDPKSDSPSFALPVMTEMHDAEGRELEHYCFDRFKLPANLTDADFDPARLGGKRK